MPCNHFRTLNIEDNVRHINCIVAAGQYNGDIMANHNQHQACSMAFLYRIFTTIESMPPISLIIVLLRLNAYRREAHVVNDACRDDRARIFREAILVLMKHQSRAAYAFVPSMLMINQINISALKPMK